VPRSLSDTHCSTAANDPRPSASFSARKNPRCIPANTPPVFPGLAPLIWPHLLRLVTKAMSDRLLGYTEGRRFARSKREQVVRRSEVIADADAQSKRTVGRTKSKWVSIWVAMVRGIVHACPVIFSFSEQRPPACDVVTQASLNIEAD